LQFVCWADKNQMNVVALYKLHQFLTFSK
jgi:hypothetical protein